MEKRRERMNKKNIGSSFDSWLREEGIYEEVSATAIKRVLSRQVEAAMKERQFSKAEMARRMRTSRAALDRDAKHAPQSSRGCGPRTSAGARLRFEGKRGRIFRETLGA
jgi:hypothetical protein